MSASVPYKFPIDQEKNLENLLTEITNPLTTHVSKTEFKKIFDCIDNDSSAPETALKILAHKMQSPQDKEALSSLTLLDMCVHYCGSSFHQELGKFKFLNEIIKILSPKYLGNSSSEVVKKKCIELLYSWKCKLSDKYPKIAEAYTMLKTQGIVTEDPTIQLLQTNQTRSASNPGTIFNGSKQAETLAKLLKSTNSQDIRQANAIIKKLVNEEDERIEKKSRRQLDLHTLQNNSTLLTDMLKHAKSSQPSASDAEIMQEIANNIRSARPGLFHWAFTDDLLDENVMAEIIDACGRASSALEEYEVVVLKKASSEISQVSPSEVSLADDLLIMESCPVEEVDLLCEQTGSKNYEASTTSSSNLHLLEDLFSYPTDNQDISKQPIVSPHRMMDESRSINYTPPCTVQPTCPIFENSENKLVSHFSGIKFNDVLSDNTKKCNNLVPNSSAKVFHDLDTVGRQLLGFVPSNDSVMKNSLIQKVQKQFSDETTNSKSLKTEQNGTESALDISKTDIASIPDISLSAIQSHPSYKEPLCIFPSQCNDVNSTHGLQVVLHYTNNQPAPNVRVFVIVVINKGSHTVNKISLRFAVDKPVRLRQLVLSETSLSPFSSFLPPSTAKLVIFVQNPTEMTSTTLRFQLSFTVDNEEDELESGKTTIKLD